ncbi:MAG TPA: efflux RND transporter periplasmic adaptor subunit, partial [Bryobacteraceae bacterium]
MRSDEINLAETTEERLRKENQDLKRQLLELKASAAPVKLWHPSSRTIWSIVFGVAVLIVVAFLGGYIPLQKRNALIDRESFEQAHALPRVEVIQVQSSSQNSVLELPGNIEPITEAPILARADGYVKRRLVDIGDRVRTGQLVAEVEAPELDEQVRQSQAALEQARASLEEALANSEQGKSNLELARVNAQRWSNLVNRGIVSRQDNDLYQTQYQSQVSGVHSLERAVAAQRGNVAAAEANVARLQNMRGYRMVKAPFDGIITLRNVDTGALVTAGGTLLFRIAQTGTLRTYVNVPQANASFVRTGQPAQLKVSNLPGRTFAGTIARTADSLDPASRTMLVEIHVPNQDGALLPGMYARVDLSSTRVHPPLLVPSDALIVRPDGTEVAVVRPDHTIHLQKIEIGRDYGDRLEIVSGLDVGDMIVQNAGDSARE